MTKIPRWIDLGDGHTQALYEEYRGRLKSAEDLDQSLGNVQSVAECVPVLLVLVIFIHQQV